MNSKTLAVYTLTSCTSDIQCSRDPQLKRMLKKHGLNQYPNSFHSIPDIPSLCPNKYLELVAMCYIEPSMTLWLKCILNT